ncbi:MAG: hypothetical protein K8R40_05615 [Anaerolineaceae bacterium]|nr:hypothetical protein [Anaerolineaceae bacterium]
MALNSHFSKQDWERIERDWTNWWAGEIDRPLVMINGTDVIGKLKIGGSMAGKALGSKSYTLLELLNQPLPTIFGLDVPVDEIIDAYSRMLSVIHCYGDMWPHWWPNFGPGIAAGFLGAEVHATPDTVWFDLPEPVNLDTCHPHYDPQNVWFQRVQEVTEAAVTFWGDQMNVGITDLGGNLDILASMRGTQQLLIDTLENPEAVQRILGEITSLWLLYHREQIALTNQNGRGCSGWAPVWAPGSSYMLQCDFSYMISPRMFKRYVMPDLEACCAELEFPFYHLDGKGEIPHIDHLLSLDKLRGIQWIPGDGAPPAEEWLPLLKRIRDGDKLCQLYVSAEGALKIVRELGGKGFALYIMDQMSTHEAKAFLKEIKEVGE